MKQHMVIFIVSSLLLTGMSAVPAHAQEAASKWDSWYVGGSIGYNQTSDQTSEAAGLLVETEFDAGLTTTSFVGKKFDNNFRAEAELLWARNDGSALAFNGVDQEFSARGAQSYNLTLNGYYDFDFGSAITPYIGVGAGIGFIENEFVYGPVNFEDSDTSFVYQATLGAALPITDKIDGFVGVKYFQGTDLEFTRTSPADNGVALESEYQNFAVSAGYRWNF